MKKALGYTITAILLGAVIMLSPLRIFYGSHGEEGPITFPELQLRTFSDLESFSEPHGSYNFDSASTSQSTDPFIGILGISFFVALVTYLLIRRRKSSAPYRYHTPIGSR